MPRGNDQTARSDLYSQYGVHGNASELIRAHAASIDPAVKRVGRLPLNVEATEEFKAAPGWRERAAKALGLPEGSEVQDVAVKGNALSVVYLDPSGTMRKGAGAANDDYRPPVLSPLEQARSEAAKVEVQVAIETAALRDQLQARLDEEREAAEEEYEAAVAAVKAEKAERLKALTEDDEGEGEGSEDDSPVLSSSEAAQLAKENGVKLEEVEGTGANGFVKKADVEKHLALAGAGKG